MGVRAVIGIVLALLATYGFIKGYPLLSGPDIVIYSPAPYASIEGGELTLTGISRRTETLTLNGGVLLIDGAGNFSTSLTLPSGGAILSLTARDRFGRSVTEQLTVYSP